MCEFGMWAALWALGNSSSLGEGWFILVKVSVSFMTELGGK